jgi:multiple sugar transport system ATP-binding protein
VIKSFATPDGKSVLAADSVNLSIGDGELFALVGPSGCGKTTLLRLIAGLESADLGRVLFNEHNVTHQSPKERDVAMVFQSHALFPHLTAFENIAFGLKLRGVARGEIEACVRDAAAMLSASHCLDRKPGKLSGGERQRVALARALVRQPKILLLDEPFSNLDEPLRIQMRNEIPLIRERSGATIIFVTHDQEEALSLGDRVGVMRNGAIQQVATPREIYNSPANRFVAAFIGSPQMNLFHGSIAQRGGRLVFVGAETEPDSIAKFVLDLGGARADWFGINVGRQVLLGFRLEHVSLADAESLRAGSGHIVGKIVGEQFIGAKTLLRAQVEGRTVCLFSDTGRHATGSEVKLCFDFNRAQIFDAATGAAIG